MKRSLVPFLLNFPVCPTPRLVPSLVCVLIFMPMFRSPLICLAFCHTASFPCLIPPQSTTFNIFVGEQDEGKEFVKRASTISGETNTIEFSGSVNDGGDGTGSKFGYLLVP